MTTSDCGGGPHDQGDVFASLSCTGTGITWSAHTDGLLPNTRITYHWNIYVDGLFLISGQHGGYYTDRVGDHSRLPSGFPRAIDCGPGSYTIDVWVTNDDGSWATFGRNATTVC